MGINLGGVFALATRVSYPFELKMKAIEMRLEGVPVREVMEQLGIRNKTKWCREGDVHRLEQPVGKQYSLDNCMGNIAKNHRPSGFLYICTKYEFCVTDVKKRIATA
jgi:hypothetical protein